jgi:GH25 family lysozyme M1 (1,4-beta-N-acetylmuramidase)
MRFIGETLAVRTCNGPIFGLDVSHWSTDCDGCKPNTDCSNCPRCVIDWSKAAQQQIKYVYAKATQGTGDGDDVSFERYWTDLEQYHQAGRIYRGAYHWLSSDPSQSGADQARHFMSVVKVADKQLPPVVDFEEDWVYRSKEYSDAHPEFCKGKKNSDGEIVAYVCDGWAELKTSEIITKLRDWLSAVAGGSPRQPIIYTRSNYWRDMLGDAGFDLIKPYAAWLAQYPKDSPHWHDAHATNSWRMPDLPKNASYPPGKSGDPYPAGHFWQFVQTAQMRTPVATCSGTPYPDHNIDVNWYPSGEADFKRAFGLGGSP